MLVSIGIGANGGTGCACLHFGTPTTHSPMGRRLAASIMRSLVDGLGMKDLGVHARSVAILRETRMPAVLVELPGDADPSTHEGTFTWAVADAIARGIEALARPVPQSAD